MVFHTDYRQVLGRRHRRVAWSRMDPDRRSKGHKGSRRVQPPFKRSASPYLGHDQDPRGNYARGRPGAKGHR